MIIEDKHWQTSSFTVGFSFHKGIANCDGFKMETVVSDALKLQYRIQVKHPVEEGFWVMKGMEQPMRQAEIKRVLKESYKGFLGGEEFIFEVFDSTGTRNLFGTRFNAKEKVPADGKSAGHVVFTSFTWSFTLPPDLQTIAKKALEDHMQKFKN